MNLRSWNEQLVWRGRAPLVGLILIGSLCLAAARPAWPAGPSPEGTGVVELLEQATQLEAAKRFDDAAVRYRAALDRRPDDDEIRGRLARVRSWQGQFEEAVALYRDILTRAPADIDTRISLARVLSWQKQWDESEGLYRAVLGEAPDSVEALQGLADTLAWSNRPAEALPYYEEVYRRTHDAQLAARIEAVTAERLAADRAALAAQVTRARELAWNKEYEEAIRLYRQVLSREPKHVDAMRGLADVLSWSDRAEEALPLYETVYRETQDPEVEQRLALVKRALHAGLQVGTRVSLDAQVVHARELSWQQQYDAAIAEYRAVLAQQPGHIEAEHGLADVLYWTGQYADALTLYQEVYAETNDPELPARIQAVKTELHLSARAVVRRGAGGIAIPFRDYLKLGYSHYTYTNQFPNERDVLIEAAKPIGDMTLVGRVEPLNRFGLRDTPVSAELYSPLWRGAWGYVAGSGAIDAKFVPSWTLGSEVFQGLGAVSPSLWFLEASFGYKRMEFRTAGIDLLTPGLTIFLPWNLWLTEKLSYVPNQGSITLSSQLTWRPQDRLQFFVSGGYGTSGERIFSVQDFTRVKSTIWQAGAIFPIAARLSGEVSGYYEDRGFLYVRRGLTFNLIWHW